MPPSLAISLFGGFTCYIHGLPLLQTRTRHATLLLALLALRYESTTERSQLAATLWPDHYDDIGRTYLRRSLLDLRTALGTEAERILSPTRQTLQLDLSGSVLFDVRDFDRAIAGGTRNDLDRAIALYRGPLLPELDELGYLEDFMHWERERRNLQFRESLEKRASLLYRENDREGAMTDLRRFLAIDPLHEPVSLRLMELLVETKNRAGALAEYERLRERLANNLGMKPNGETQVFAERLQQSLASVASMGREPTKPASSPSIPTRMAPTIAGVPLPRTRFFGRESERQRLRDWIAGVPDGRQRLVTLTGPPGIGKTRLSIEAARIVALQREDIRSVWFVPFADVRGGPAAVWAALGRALGIPGKQADDPKAIADVLRGDVNDERIGLLVLDNLEHLLTEEGASTAEPDSDNDVALLVDRLLNEVLSLTCFVTSRRPLQLGGEQELRLRSLNVSSLAEAEGGDDNAAVALFVDRARLADAVFAPDSGNLSDIASLCRYLEGVPLALEMAAARIRDDLTPLQILEQLTERQPALDSLQRDLPVRQRSLYAAIDWSYGLLSEKEKAVLARLSVFVGGCTVSAAKAVTGFGVVEPEQVSDLLERLTANSLLIKQRDANKPRYRMLEFVRQYAQLQQQERGEMAAVRRRHGDWYLALASEGATRVYNGPEQMQWVSQMEREHDNFRVALATNGNQNDAALGQDFRLRLSGYLSMYWYLRGDLKEGREYLRRALAPLYGAATGASSLADYIWSQHDRELSQDAARALKGEGILALAQGDSQEARQTLQAALALCRWLDEANDVRIILSNLGGLDSQAGDFTAARAYLEESLVLARKLGNKRGVAGTLNNIGDMAMKQGDYTVARAYLEEGLHCFREIGEKHGIAMTLNNLGEVTAYQSEYGAARRFFQEALRCRLEIGDKRGITFSLRGLAQVCLALSETRTAVVLLGAEHTLRKELGLTLSPSDQTNLERHLAQATAALLVSDAGNGNDFDAAWNEGRQRGWEQTIPYLLGEISP